nr:reverse transcriptase domain-containing protein [Tanacetum cinerariifolium]
MRPFGCPVTILNTLDSLGKFGRKVDEECLVGYSISSKAFRVFNSRTQIIQETLHVNFLENKPNVTWEENVPKYVLFPVWSFGSTNHQNTNGDATFDAKEPKFERRKPESEVNVSTSSSAQSKKHDDKTKREAKGKSPVKSLTGYRNLSADFEDVSDNNINKDNAAGTLVLAVGQISPNSTNTFSAVGPSNAAPSPTQGKSSYVDSFQLLDDPNMPELEDITYSDDEDDVGVEADFNNLETSITVSPILTTRVHKDHHVTQIIEEPKRVHQALKDLIWIEAVLEGASLIKNAEDYASFMGFMVYQMDVKSAFLYGTIEEEVYVCQPLGFKDPDYPDKKSASTPIDTAKPLLKDPDDEDVDVHTNRSMIVKRIFRYLKGKPHLGLWYPKDSPFELVAYSDSNYAGASLDRKSTTRGCQFLRCRLISWKRKKHTVVETSSTKAEYVAAANCCVQVLWIQNQLLDYGYNFMHTKVNDLTRLEALVDKKKIIIMEATIRDALCLNDAEGVECLPNEEIFTDEHHGMSLVSLWHLLSSAYPQGIIVEQQVDEGAAKVNVKDVSTAGVAAEDDVSKQERIIVDMDADVDVILEDAKEVAVEKSADVDESADILGRQAESQAQIYQINLEHANKVLSMKDDEVKPAELQEVVEVVTTATLITEVVTAASATITAAAPQLTTAAAPTLTTAPSAARRKKEVVIRDPQETATPSTIIHSEAKSKDKGKGILTEAQARKNMMIYLRSVAGFKMDYFKGMTYDDIRPIFEKKFNSNVAFLMKTKEQMDAEDSRALKRLSESRYTSSNLEESKKCSWSSEGQELEAVRVLWCANYHIHYNTVDFACREEISTYKVTDIIKRTKSKQNRTKLSTKWKAWKSQKSTKVNKKSTQLKSKSKMELRSRVDPTLLNDFEMATNENGDPPVLDLRTMEELCQPSLNGRGGPIAPIPIQATNFVLKNDMIQQVQNSCQFHGLLGDDASKHLDKFLHVTQSIKVNGVIDDAVRLYLFPYSLTHHATAWFDRLPRNSINTFEQMAKMFLGKYFPPSMVTKLRNEITNFCNVPNESLFEAWECYKLSIDRCPNHNMFPVTQIDTFYNGLTLRHRDTINATAGGTFMKRRPEECYDLIKNITAHNNDWDTSAQQSGLSSSTTSSSDSEIVALKAEMAEFNKNLMKANDAILKNMKTNMTSLTNSNLELKNKFGQFMKMNIASSLGSGTLPSNTVTNPKEDLEVERVTEVTKDMVPPTNNRSTKDVQRLVVQVETPILSSEPVVAPVAEPVVAPVNALKLLLKKLPEKLGDPGKFLIPCDFLRMDECLALADLDASINLMPLSVWKKLSLPELSPTCMTLELKNRSISCPVGVAEDVFVKTEKALIDVYEGELILRVGKEAITFNLDQTSRYSANYNYMTANRIDVIDMACKEYSQEVLSFSDVIASVDAFLALEDDLTSPEVDHSYYDTKGDILLLEAFLNDDPSLTPPTQGMYLPQV